MGKKKPCNCPDKMRQGEGDDDRFAAMIKPSLIQALTPIEFSIELKIRASLNLDYAKFIVQRFDTLAQAANSDDDIKDIVQALDDVIEEMEALPRVLPQAIHDLFEEQDELTDIGSGLDIEIRVVQDAEPQ